MYQKVIFLSKKLTKKCAFLAHTSNEHYSKNTNPSQEVMGLFCRGFHALKQKMKFSFFYEKSRGRAKQGGGCARYSIRILCVAPINRGVVLSIHIDTERRQNFLNNEYMTSIEKWLDHVSQGWVFLYKKQGVAFY